MSAQPTPPPVVNTAQAKSGLGALGSASSAMSALANAGTWAVKEFGEQVAQMRGAILIQDSAIPVSPYDIMSRNTATSIGTKALVCVYFGQCNLVNLWARARARVPRRGARPRAT